MGSWHIVTCEYPPDIGGVSDYTRQVANALARAGDEVHVWCPGADSRIELSGVRVHAELGRFRPVDFRRLDRLLAPFPAPRRLLVQWVPHGFRYRSMNIWFCFWLAKRARAGDSIELMVHEPYIEFRLGPIRHSVVALVHRLMTVVLLGAARRVWMATPAWERRLRPYALGRRIPMQWLPVPGCASLEALPMPSERRTLVREGQKLVGHFGSFGSAVTSLLEERLPAIMDGALRPALLLIGVGSERFRDVLVQRHPSWSQRVHATGSVGTAELGAYLACCDLFLQPYPDGITSRRTSAMACLSHGLPVVTTAGHLTEPLWAETRAVALADVADPCAFSSAATALLENDQARREVGARALLVYGERFSIGRVVDALRAA